MHRNGKLFEAKIEFTRSGMDRAEQVRAIKQIGLDWIGVIRVEYI